MFTYVKNRFIRRPMAPLLCLLFAAIMAFALCSLQRSIMEERVHYDETYHSVPVYFSVTNLSATQFIDLKIHSIYTDLFTGWDRQEQRYPGYGPYLTDYVSDLEMISKRKIDDGVFAGRELIGVTGTYWMQDCDVNWYADYDESVFLTDEMVCLIPEEFAKNQQSIGELDFDTGAYVELEFEHVKDLQTGLSDGYDCQLKVVGTVTGLAFYCPYYVTDHVFVELKEEPYALAIRATLSDNDFLDELRTDAAQMFAEPNPLGQQTPWCRFGREYYEFALDINDTQLREAKETLEASLTINRICTVLIYILSVAASFFFGFLMIRSRKREIALMRTMGTLKWKIYGSFAFEQMLCVVLGMLLGGSYFLWQPIERLSAFVGIYFVGLSLALLIFLNTNLLTTIKEDE